MAKLIMDRDCKKLLWIQITNYLLSTTIILAQKLISE